MVPFNKQYLAKNKVGGYNITTGTAYCKVQYITKHFLKVLYRKMARLRNIIQKSSLSKKQPVNIS